MTAASRKYSQEFKQNAVALSREKESIQSAADELGVPYVTLYTWRRKADSENGHTNGKRYDNVPEMLDDLGAGDIAENIALRNAVRQLYKLATTMVVSLEADGVLVPDDSYRAVLNAHAELFKKLVSNNY